MKKGSRSQSKIPNMKEIQVFKGVDIEILRHNQISMQLIILFLELNTIIKTDQLGRFKYCI